MCLGVYAWRMSRTNIDIDDELVARVMRSYRLESKKAAVDFALRRVLHDPMTTDEVLGMRGSCWEGDLDAMRGGVPAEAR